VLIDADLRRPNVHHRFGLTGKLGLTTVLAGTSSFEEAVQHVPEMPNLDILPSGPVPPVPHRDAEFGGDAGAAGEAGRAVHLRGDRLSAHPLGDRRRSWGAWSTRWCW
jgi:hypothetical protein